MNGFLAQVAKDIYHSHMAEPEGLRIVFPSKRARLFFDQQLSELLDAPVWQPEYMSIDDMVQELSGMALADELRLITLLHEVYTKYHNEPLDKFYQWGLMLLSDFDTIDKYMVRADELYTNISDIKELDQQFEQYDSDERELILGFWRTFSSFSDQSTEQQKFLGIWRSLAAVYKEFSDVLGDLGIAYSGMQYRALAERVASADRNAPPIDSHTYCFVGFNALSESERVILNYFKERGNAHFYWDYDNYYTFSPERHQAGRFIERNISALGGHSGIDTDNFASPKQIRAVACPSDIMQCKVLYRELEDIFKRQGYIDKETAVVLTDESLLIPVLNSIPEFVGGVNITMGYPLFGTVPYTFTERLLELQNTANAEGFYHGAVVSLLRHPYLNGPQNMSLVELIHKGQYARVPAGFFAENPSTPLTDLVFRTSDTPVELGRHLIQVLESCYDLTLQDQGAKERRHFLFMIIDTIQKIESSVEQSSAELSFSIYVSLLRQKLRAMKIPYTGEPLGGLQVMGILETRCLDFENIIYLSVTDDNFPSTIQGSSYIPMNLRQGFALPVVADHEAVYAYYFYRSIQRCKNLTMLYCSSSEGLRSGEQTRYIYQLDYQSPHKVLHSDIILKVSPMAESDFKIEKTEPMLEKLRSHHFSPSQLKTFLDCSMRFYLRNVATVRQADELPEQGLSKAQFGNLVHKTIEALYRPLMPEADHQGRIRAITPTQIDHALSQALEEVAGQRHQNLGGAILLSCDVARAYVGYIIDYDANVSEPFRIEALEGPVVGIISGLKIGGFVDRVDRMASGDIRVVDYKTGRGDKTTLDDLASLLEPKGNRAALQTITYAHLLRQQFRCDVIPSLYICPKMYDHSFSPYLSPNNEPQNRFRLDGQTSQEFADIVSQIHDMIFDMSEPFSLTPDINQCQWCGYKRICGRR